MKKILLLIIIVLLLSCTVNNSFHKENTFLGYIKDANDNMQLLLDTNVSLTTLNNEHKQELIDCARNTITKYHQLLDCHHHYIDENSNEIINICSLNENINNGSIIVDPIIIDAISEAIELTKLTEGYFNITIGDLSNLYHDKFLPYDSYNEDPPIANINDCLKGIIDYKNIDEYIIVDKTNNTIELKSNGAPYLLDLGAFSKGYIIDKVYDELIKYNTSFMLDAGSSSIATYINQNENISWNIGIKDPDNTESKLMAFNLNNGALSTSGNYEQYYLLKDGTRRHHILNPYTGYSEDYYLSNTIICDNAYVADSLSTALFNINDLNKIKEIIKNVSEHYNVAITYFLLKDDYEVIIDDIFKELLIDDYTSDKIKL